LQIADRHVGATVTCTTWRGERIRSNAFSSERIACTATG
jgi:hypothetical protein